MSQLKLNVVVELVGLDGARQCREIAIVDRSVDGVGLDALGLSLAEGKAIQGRLQEELTQFRGRFQGVHDYRSRTVHSLFGICHLRVPRFRSCTCGKPAKSNTGNIETLLKGRATAGNWSAYKRSSVRACRFVKQLVYSTFFVPTRGGPHNHRTVVNRLAKVADQIEKWDAASPYRMSRAGGSPISVFIDGAYIRAVPGYQSRHFEIAMGRVVSPGRLPRQFAAAPHVTTGKHDAVRAAMRAQGWLPGRDVTVFSDGDVGLQSIVLSATRQPVTHIL